MNLRKLLTTDWISLGLDKAEEKGKELGHKTKTKIHKPTSYERLNHNKRTLPKPFKKKKRISLK